MTGHTIQSIPRRLRTSAWVLAAIVWLASLIVTPISLWIGGEPTFPVLASLGVLAQLLTVLLALAKSWPISRIAWTAALVFFLCLGIELLGISSGFPFGSYGYSPRLQPQLGGVPVLIPLAWLMMLLPAWGISAAILLPVYKRLGKLYWPAFALIAGLAFTAWDLYLDPQMTAHNLWTWTEPGGYFGIPWKNYLGWLISSSLLTLIIRPDKLPLLPLAVVYTLTWTFQAVGLGLFWGQPGPALAGFAGMGFFACLAWVQLRRGHV